MVYSLWLKYGFRKWKSDGEKDIYYYIYRLWHWIGERLGYCDRIIKEMDEHQKKLAEQLAPDFERVRRKFWGD